MNKRLNNILLIDDNYADNYYHKVIIEDLDISNQINSVLSGEEGIKYLTDVNHIPPDLIFLDINMAKMNGWEFLANFKKLNYPKKVHIVLITTSHDPDDAEMAKRHNEIKGYYTKPIDANVVLKILKKMY
jgi:CheY-like chemotaxis protein